jgi:DNA-binding transcriptional ArsR family regulator
LDPHLSHAAVRVLCVLGKYADSSDFTSYPGVSTIAAVLGCSDRNVQNHLRQLEELGYIKTELRYRAKSGGNATNRYRLCFPPLPTSAPSSGGVNGTGGDGGADPPESRSSAQEKANASGVNSDFTPRETESDGVKRHFTPLVKPEFTPGVKPHFTQTNPDLPIPLERTQRVPLRGAYAPDDLDERQQAHNAIKSALGEERYIETMDLNVPLSTWKQAEDTEMIEAGRGSAIIIDALREARAEKTSSR